MYVAEEGFYHNGIGIFKVKTNSKSGRRYASMLVEVGNGQFKWEYYKGAVTKLTPQTKMKAEVAAKFGALYGTCMCCMRPLDNDESIARGIGPVCYAKYF